MKRRTQIILIIVIFPLLLVVFTIVHELGHTILARLLGDPGSIFYLYKIEETSACLGCNIYDHTKLSYSGNLIVSIAGLAFTQMAAFAALIGARYIRIETFPHRLLTVVGLSFAFSDVPVQVIQGVLYDISRLAIITCSILLLFGCRLLSIEIPEEATPEPPPTPILCTPLPGDMTFQVIPLSSTSLEIIMTGLQPGEIPLVTIEARTSDGSFHLEATQNDPADASGQLDWIMAGLDFSTIGPPPPYWHVLVAHEQGVACATATLP